MKSTANQAAVHRPAAVHTSRIVRGRYGNCAASFRSFAASDEASRCNQPIMGQHVCRPRPVSKPASQCKGPSSGRANGRRSHCSYGAEEPKPAQDQETFGVMTLSSPKVSKSAWLNV